MNNFETALRELDEEWFATLPPVEKVYEHELSKKYLKWEQRVIYGKKSTASKVFKVALIAAALLILFSVIALSTTKGREFFMKFFKDSAVYSLYAERSQDVLDINVKYLPKGFVLKNSFKHDTTNSNYYESENKWLEVQKVSIETTVDFDYKENDNKTFEYNGITYYISFVDNNICNVFWNCNEYYYQVSGNIDRETALKIAYNVE